MRTWDNTKPVDNDKAWLCSKCNWTTQTSFGEYSLAELIERTCPKCGEKTLQRSIYICVYCNSPYYGAEDYNWHSLYRHWYTYFEVGRNPLYDPVAQAMKKLYPGLWENHLRYLDEHR